HVGHARKRHRTWAIHRPVHRGETWRPSLCRKRRSGARQHVYHSVAQRVTAMSTILIVEDEQHLADGLRFNLEAEDYTVELVDNGEDALRLLTETPTRFDAVLLDVMLPGIDGFQVVRELRKAGQFIPVLMLTARDHA